MAEKREVPDWEYFIPGWNVYRMLQEHFKNLGKNEALKLELISLLAQERSIVDQTLIKR